MDGGMVDFEWDPEKARSNLQKHGISFADAVSVLEDDLALTLQDDHQDELRYITLGRDLFGRILVVVYTYRKDAIRIISARKATSNERRQFENEN
jgi:hypothetical protein